MKYLSSFILIFSINSFAITCVDDDIDLNPGDVISADMIKDIFDRISGVSSGMTPEELDGTWMCTSFNRQVNTLNGYSADSDGIGSSMSQDITFTKQSDDTFIVTYQNNLGQNFVSTNPGNTCKGKLIDGALFVTIEDAGLGTCYNTGLYGMKRLSKQCFVWEVTNSFPLASATSCIRKSPVPLAPTDLTATLSVSGTSGVVSLSWTAGDSNTDSYTIKAKTSNTGTYSDVTTELSGTSYTDTLSSGTKWYRVYGVNASGTSTGSNVVSISYSE